MIKIEYPEYDFRIRNDADSRKIFDESRKQWLKLTPEEWVRQNFVRYMLKQRVPAAMIALEKKIAVGEMAKRFDILVYDKNHAPWMMVECKAMDVPLSSDVLQQVLRYNIGVPVKYLLITNGSHCRGFVKEGTGLVEVAEFPDWEG